MVRPPSVILIISTELLERYVMSIFALINITVGFKSKNFYKDVSSLHSVNFYDAFI